VGLAGFMSVWLTGIVFLFCCEQMNAASMEPEFCPLRKMSKHCDRMKESDAPTVGTTSTESFKCCGFLPIVFDKVRKIERSESFAVANAPAVVQTDLTYSTVRTYQKVFHVPRIESRQGTYLRNCNFRI